MVSKEELKEMYYYIGPYFYKNKLVRIFRTKKDYSFVFYYDNKGEYTLMGVRDTNRLAKILTPNDKILSNNGNPPKKPPILKSGVQVQQITPTPNLQNLSQDTKTESDFFDFEFEDSTTLFENNKPQKAFSLNSNSIEAKVVSNEDENSNLITFEIVDKSSSEPFVCRITFENQAKNSNRGNLLEEDIYTVIESIEENKKYCDSTKILKRLDGYNVVLQDAEQFNKEHKEQGNTFGICCLESHKIFLNIDKSNVEYYEEYIKNNKDKFKAVFKHELNHAESCSYNKYEDPINGYSSFTNNGVCKAWEEMFTEFLAGQVNGEYSGYSDFMEIFTKLLGDNPPKEALEAFFDNNQEKFYESLGAELNSPIDQVINFSLVMDTHKQIEYDSKYMDSNKKAKLLEQYRKTESMFIMQFKINQINKNGAEVTPEMFEKMASEFGFDGNDMIEQLKAFVLADKSNATAETIAIRINAIQSLLSSELPDENGISKYNQDSYLDAFNKLLPEDKQQNNITDIYNFLFNTDEKIDTDYAHFYAFTSDGNQLLSQLNNIEKCFGDRTIVSVQQSLLNQKFENKEEKLLSLYETNNEFYKGLVKSALIYGSNAYIDYYSTNMAGKLYNKLSDEEKAEILTDINKVQGEAVKNTELYNMEALLACYTVKFEEQMQEGKIENLAEYFKVFPNKQIADMMLDTLINNNSVENVYEYMGTMQVLFNGYYDSKEICEIICKKILGEEYNKHLEEFNEYYSDPDSIDMVYGLTQDYYLEMETKEQQEINQVTTK